MTLRWTTLDADSVTAWAALVNHLAEFDGHREFYEAEDLAEEMLEYGFIPEQDSIAVWDGDNLIAYTQVRASFTLVHETGHARAQLSGGVHPDYRNQGIATAMFNAMEPRGIALARERHPEAPIELRCFGGLETDPVRALLTDRGYQAERYFTALERPLPGTDFGAPDARITAWTAELSEATRLAHNDAFTTHWGSSPQTVEQWNEFIDGRQFRPAYSRLAVDADGQVLAYSLTQQWESRALYIALIGTRCAARGQGLARAALTTSLTAAAESGEFDLSEIDVDAASPQGADKLYRSVGFTPTRTTAVFVTHHT